MTPGMGDGFDRGTNYNARMAHAATVQAERIAMSLARAATVISADLPCATCGHPASAHDIDRAVLVPGQSPGGEGCIADWTAEAPGCGCQEFVVAQRPA